jgi:hypothetical protein
MKQIDKMRERWNGLSDTVLRFSFAIIMLVAAVISNIIAINTQEDENYIKLLVTFLLGASLFIVLQLLYERFFDKRLTRIGFMVVTAAFSTGYYFIIRKTNWEEEVSIRTIVILFLLLIAFLWVPVIKSRNNFNESFMAVFKAFFISLLFTGVLFLGICLILGATDTLITPINEKSYLHTANIIFVLLAPIYFLSLIPIYPGKKELAEVSAKIPKDGNLEQQNGEIKITEEPLSQEQPTNQEDNLVKLITPTRFLETLISYVIIPITAVFTIILLLYIVMNITGSFWTDNLLEPMLVSYSITVIFVYLLTSTLKNAVAGYFRKIFPKVLVLVVLFETLSSILLIGDVGITYGRYYVILFGVFATIAGIIFSVVPVRKNGIIAPILMTLALLSILPPVDAFTVSKSNQIGRLESVLIRNNMLEDHSITPKANVPEEDQDIIVTTINYLDRMEYTEGITWLSDYQTSMDFEKVFGFTAYGQIDEKYQSIYLERDQGLPLAIDGYDLLLHMNYYNKTSDLSGRVFELRGKSYTLYLNSPSDENAVLILQEVDGQELIQFEMNEIFSRLSSLNLNKSEVSNDEYTFIKDNAAATMKLVVDSFSKSEWESGKDQQVTVNVLIKIK